jgi:hypothetical protein
MGNWTVVTSGTTEDLFDVWASSSADVYIVGGMLGGSSGIILHGSGNSWTQTTSPILVLGVSGASNTSAFAVGTLGQEASMMHWDGGMWSERGVIAGGSAMAVWMDAAGTDAYIVGSSSTAGFVYRSRDGGATWQSTTVADVPPLLAVWGSSANDVYAVGQGSLILHSTDRGVSWTSASNLNISIALRGVWGSSADDIYTVGGTGGSSAVLHSTNRGASWTVTPAGTFGGGFNLNDISGTSASDVYVVGPGGRIYHSTGADIWTAENSPTTQELLGVWGIPGGDVYAVGRSGTILHKAASR